MTVGIWIVFSLLFAAVVLFATEWLSFASMLGGVCTLLGSSTNILVSSIAQDHGEEPFGMFEFAPFGLVLLAAGFLYLFTVGIRGSRPGERWPISPPASPSPST